MVYCSVDETYASKILAQFQQQTGIAVQAVYDSEAGKTTGLVNRIIAESRSSKPRADVFWSGELFGTMQLAELNLLERYDPPSAADIPPRFRDVLNRWTAVSVRARVLAFDPSKTPPEKLPARWDELAQPQFAPHVTIANPLFGTTRGHVAAMFATWGAQKAGRFLRQLREGRAQIVDGNSASVRAVIDGRAQLAVTDSDDVFAARRAGAGIESKMLDMGDGGTLLIPCSVGLIKGTPSDAAKQLVDFLVSAQVERLLAQSESRNIPVRQSLRSELNMDWPAETKISFTEIFRALESSDTSVREILLR